MENPIKMDDLGGTIIFGNTHLHPFALLTYDFCALQNHLGRQSSEVDRFVPPDETMVVRMTMATNGCCCFVNIP